MVWMAKKRDGEVMSDCEVTTTRCMVGAREYYCVELSKSKTE